MKKSLLLIILVFLVMQASAQLAPHKYLVRFTDKNNSPYSISNPSAFLTAKAIARRNNQGIAIKYNDLPVSPAYIDSVASTGAIVICRSKWFNSVTIFTVDSIALAKIHSFPFVVSVDSIWKVNPNSDKMISPVKKFEEVNLSANAHCADISSTTGGSMKVNSYDYGNATNQVTMIGCEYLHNLGYRGQGMTIAVIDGGFNSANTIHAFDSLWANNQILGTRDFVQPGDDVFSLITHGMMVLSIMGANVPGVIVGTAPRASYWLLRSEDGPTENIIEEYNWASAAEFADSVGADVINSSLGYTTFDKPWMDHTYADMNGHTCPSTIAATIAAEKGMIVCNSAGNSGGSPWHYIGAPADADSILTVGAVDDQEHYAAFSSTGPTADGRIKPTVATQGQSTVVADGSVQGWTSGSGTSFSSPVLAGATACLWQAFPSLTNMQIIEAIKESASQFTNPDSLLGWGIPNFAAANAILTNIKIHNLENDNTFNIFPNPFSEVIYLLFYSSDTESVDIDIYDIMGKKVYSQENLHRISGYSYFTVSNISSLSKGIYMIRVATKGKVYTKKIMKVN